MKMKIASAIVVLSVLAVSGVLADTVSLRVTEASSGWTVVNQFDSTDTYASGDVITGGNTVSIDVSATNAVCVEKADGTAVSTCGTTGTVTAEMDQDLIIKCQDEGVCGHGSFTLKKGDKMPGGAGIAAGFIIGVIFTVAFCGTIYYYQSRDEKRQKEQQIAQANQLAEATKKAAEATSPTTAQHLQQAIVVQAGHPNSPNHQAPMPLSPNMIMVSAAGTPPMQMQQQPQMMMQQPMMMAAPGQPQMMMAAPNQPQMVMQPQSGGERAF